MILISELRWRSLGLSVAAAGMLAVGIAWAATHAETEAQKPAAVVADAVSEAAGGAEHQAQPRAESSSVDLGALLRLPELARQGRFEAVLEQVRAGSLGSDRRVDSLLAALERQQKLDVRRTEAHRKAYESAIEKMKEAAAQGRLEAAIYHAVEARTSAPDIAEMLKAPYIRELVAAVEARADQSAEDNQWVEVWTLYRALNLLFEEQAVYRERMRAAQRRVELLRLYTPDIYSKLINEMQQRQAEASDDPDAPEPRPIDLGDNKWQDRIKNIRVQMVREALQLATRLHLDQEGLLPLLEGAIQSLSIMVQTPALTQEFAGLGNEAAVRTFRGILDEALVDLRREDRNRLNELHAFRLIEQVLDANRQSIQLPEEVILYEFANGAMMALDDYSGMVWPVDLADLARTLQGSFVGVGISIERRDARLTVSSPLEGTPAHRAGILPGDVIATVDGRPTDGWSLEHAVREITGKEGTVVVLGIQRKGRDGLIEMSITRAPIPIHSVMGWQRKPGGGWDYLIDPDSGIGYIRLSSFAPDTRDDLLKALEELEKTGRFSGLILDLRGNPGGLLNAAADVVNLFINEGLIVSTVGVQGAAGPPHYARAHGTLRAFPMVVLVDGGSASASEIVAGALQDHRRATIIGSRSFGKGTVQVPIPIDTGRARVKLTIQHYKLPGGRIIHRNPGDARWGVEPDLAIRMNVDEIDSLRTFRRELDILRDDNGNGNAAETDDEYPADPPAPATASQLLTEGIDPQLSAAVLVLKTRLVTRELAIAEIQRIPVNAAP